MNARISAADAKQIAISNKRGRARARGTNNLVEPECWPVLRPKFRFEPGAKIFTIGSCFARNIERHMAALGFNVPTMQLDPSSILHGNTALLNKYTPPTIYQELKWAHDILKRDGKVVESDLRPLFLELDDGRVIDMHVFPLEPMDYDTAVARRQAVYEVFSQAFSAEVVIITLGLIEAWWDSVSKLYVLRLPEQEFKGSGSRFYFERLTYAQCYDYVRKALDLLDSAGPRKYLITTSPVVLQRTFTEDDIIVANMFSKSMLRTVAGQIVSERENVDYFPSFESVMLTKQKYVWKDDLMHVSESFVRRIMDRVAVAYAGRSLDEEGPQLKKVAANDDTRAFADLMMDGQVEKAANKFADLTINPLSVDDSNFHVGAALLMQKQGRKSEATAHSKRAIEVGDAKHDVQFRLVDVLLWAGETKEADELKEVVIERASRRPGIAIRIINQLVEQGRFREAMQLGERVAESAPAHGKIHLRLADLYEEVGRTADAIRTLRRTLASDSNFSRGHFKLGSLLLSQGNGSQSEGIAALEEAVRLEPDNPGFLHRLAIVYAETEKYPEAEVLFKKIVVRQPDDSRSRRAYGAFLRGRGRMGEAKDELNAAAKLDQ